MEKIVRYVELVSEMERAIDNNEDYKLTAENKELIKEIQEKMKEDEEFKKKIYEVFKLPPEKRAEYLKQDNKEEEKIENEDSIEEAIAKTFDIDITDINHHFLQNGKEIFSFYSNLLRRNVVLESETNGKSLVDVLKELQEEVKNEEENNKGEDILVDESKRSNIELEMHTKEEIENNPAIFASLSEDDEEKLHYLLQNYDNLRIQGINVKNMIFIDKDGKIKEVTLNKNREIMIAEPMSENSSNEQEQENISKEETSELDSMISDDDSENIEYEDEKLEEIEKEKEKGKVYVYKNEDGFINYIFYIFLAVLSLVLTTIFIVGL